MLWRVTLRRVRLLLLLELLRLWRLLNRSLRHRMRLRLLCVALRRVRLRLRLLRVALLRVRLRGGLLLLPLRGRPQKLERLAENLRDVSFGAVLSLILARPELALHVYLGALPDVLLGHIHALAVDDYVEPFGLLLTLAVPVRVFLRGGEGELGHPAAVLERDNLGVLARVADYHYLVE